MSEETDSIVKEPDLSALDSVLSKYGSSSPASQKKRDTCSSLDSGDTCEIQPPSKSFLQEIQERAQILSCQRERSAKVTLRTVVAGKQDYVQTEESNLDDFVKLLRAAPIGEELHYQPLGFESDYHQSSSGQDTGEAWSLESASRKATRWNLKSGEKSQSDSEATLSNESDTEIESDSDASDNTDFNFTWEVNTEATLPTESASEAYFHLDALQESEPVTKSTAEGYFQLSALDENITMADDGEPPIPVITTGEDEDQQDLKEDDVVSLSDDEQVSDREEVVMEVDESSKSFATLEEDKALDGFINETTEEQSKSKFDDSIASGDETVKTKEPSEDDDDWVFLAKDVDGKEEDGKEEDAVEEGSVETDGHQDKKRKIGDEEEAKTEEVNIEDTEDEVVEKPKDDPEVEEEEADGNTTPQTPEKSITDDKSDDNVSPSTEGVVLRQKPHGIHNVSPEQRYSLPEFALFDSAKTLDVEMLKSRARLGKQGALAQRRKPRRPSQDPSKRQTWMFGDPNDTSQLKGISEEAEKGHSKGSRLSAPDSIGLPSKDEGRTSPKPKPRKPIGGVGGPMLLVGMGGPAMLKKTTKKSPIEDKSISPQKEEPSKSKQDPPRIIKPKPARPTPAARPPKPNTTPSWLKTKPETSEPEEKPNGDILKAQEETNTELPHVPSWEAEKRLPPISPRADDATVKETKPTKKVVAVPLWKQELMKKKRDGDTGKKRFSLPPPVAKKPEASDSSSSSSSPFTTMPQWQVDLAEKKNRRKSHTGPEAPITTTEIEIKDETPSTANKIMPLWKIEAAEREKRQREEKAKVEKARDEKLKEFERAKKEESAPLSPLQQTTSETTNTIITKKDSSEDEKEEKKDKPKPSGPSWKEDANENTQKKKDMENKRPKPKVMSKKPVLTPKPKPSQLTSQTYNADTPQWKKDLVKKRKTSDWRTRLRSASIDQNNPPSPTSNSNEESNKLNDSQTAEENSTTDKNQQDTKRHTICTITDLPVKFPHTPPSHTVPQWKIDLEKRNRSLSDRHRSESSVPDN